MRKKLADWMTGCAVLAVLAGGKWEEKSGSRFLRISNRENKTIMLEEKKKKKKNKGAV